MYALRTSYSIGSMIKIEEYILLSREQRRSHLKLHDPCIERGGFSVEFKGMLADYLNTSIPKGYKIYLCHACHNEKCSNKVHLYWGTPTDNRVDAVENGYTNNFGDKRNTADKVWMSYNGLTRLICLYDKELFVTLGWKEGREGFHPSFIVSSELKAKISNGRKLCVGSRNQATDTVWMNKEDKNIRIEKNLIALATIQGWKLGKIQRMYAGKKLEKVNSPIV